MFLSLWQGSLAGAQPQGTAVDQPKPGLQVATLDQDALFLQSQYGLRVQQELGAERSALEAENRRIEAELIAEELALTEERSALDMTTFAEKANAFDVRVQQIRQEQDQKALALQRKFEQERQRFLSLIGPALVETLQATGAAVLLNRDAVIFAVEGVDITERAIAAVDRRLGASAAVETPADSVGGAGETSDPGPDMDPAATPEAE